MNQLIILFVLAVSVHVSGTLKAVAQSPESSVNFVKTQGIDPADYLISKFAKYDVVLAAEDHAVKQNLQFIIKAIPRLYGASVYTLGMEFGAFEMQGKLDSLLLAPAYNASVARDMFYFYNVGWAYQEYQDVYKAVWEFNRTLPTNARKFRVLNLSYQYRWENYQEPKTPENVLRVFPRGTPDYFRAGIVEREIIQKNEKALLLVGSVHAFTHYRMPLLDLNADNFCRFDNGFLGNRLTDKYPGRIVNIMLHYPFYNKPGMKPYISSPANGMLEQIMKANNYKPVGFDLEGTPIGQLRDSSIFSMCYPDFKLEKIFSGYIFLVPFEKMEGCSIDEKFFDGKDWKKTASQIPDPDWRSKPSSQNEYWNQIRAYADMRVRYAELFAK